MPNCPGAIRSVSVCSIISSHNDTMLPPRACLFGILFVTVLVKQCSLTSYHDYDNITFSDSATAIAHDPLSRHWHTVCTQMQSFLKARIRNHGDSTSAAPLW